MGENLEEILGKEAKEKMKKAFNKGFQFYLVNPELAISVAKAIPQPYDEYGMGFTSGVIQSVKEKGIEIDREKESEGPEITL